MKLSDRIKRKMMGVNLSSVAFFAVSMIAITLAWFAYTNTISSNFNVNLKSWNIKITKNNTEVSNTFTINLDDVYPGMTDFSETYSISNNGDLPAKIDYNITYFRVFNDEVTLNNDITFYEITRDYPFKIEFDYDSRYLYMGNTKNFTISCTWPLDSGNDQLDTQYGNMASAFYQQEQQHHNQDPTYIIRPGIELRIEIVISQFIDESNSFSSDSWDTIQLAIESGSANTKYNVGDTKTVSVNGTNHTVRIANKSKPSACSGSNYSQTACGWVFEFTDILKKRAMNSTNTNVGGYPETLVYDYLRNDLYSDLPYELRRTITSTKVISGHGSSDSNNFITYDKLYLLSRKEINGTDNYDTAASFTHQLEYYSNNSVTASNNCSYAIKKYQGNNSDYWLRPALSPVDYGFLFVGNNGSVERLNANINSGIAPAFRIE